MALSKEQARKRRENPEYRERQKVWYSNWYANNKDTSKYKARQAKDSKRRRMDPANHQRIMARRMLNNLLRTGRVIKEPCFCGETLVERHHEDYSKGLDVIWLCQGHHREIHTKAQGEDYETRRTL